MYPGADDARPSFFHCLSLSERAVAARDAAAAAAQT